MLASHHSATLAWLREVVDVLGHFTSNCVDVAPLTATCLGGAPCSGHRGAKITFASHSVLNVECDSVCIGAIMWYYGKGTAHFRDNIDAAFASYLCEGLGITGPPGDK